MLNFMPVVFFLGIDMYIYIYRERELINHLKKAERGERVDFLHRKPQVFLFNSWVQKAIHRWTRPSPDSSFLRRETTVATQITLARKCANLRTSCTERAVFWGRLGVVWCV